MSNLSEVRSELDKVCRELTEKHEFKDKIAIAAREAQRFCGESVSAIHRGDLELAREKLMAAEEKFSEIKRFIEGDPELMSGTVLMSLQEYVEAKSLFEIVTKSRLPLLSELSVPPQAYALGLADLIGELRRRVIDCLREDRLEDAERFLDLMESIHVLLQPLEYPRSLVPGLRGKLDVMRRLIEDTRRIIVDAVLSTKLRREVEKAMRKMGIS